MFDYRAPHLSDVFVPSYEERVRRGDIFDYKHVVVPIKAGGRAYGSISKQMLAKYPVALPNVKFGEAVLVKAGDREFICVGYWTEHNAYTPDSLRTATTAAIKCYSWRATKRDGTLAFPVFAGMADKDSMKVAFELGVQDVLDDPAYPDVLGVFPPDEVVVVELG